MPRKVLILGATSAIAQETSKLLAGDGDRLFLVARDATRLRIVAGDLQIRGAETVSSAVADLNDFDRHAEIVEQAAAALDGLDTVIVAHGLLGSQREDQESYRRTEAIIRANFLSPVSLLVPIVRRFEAQGAGTIVGISSVAGDRGRQSNYIYGASKGALSLYLQGLRNRLHDSGVQVVTVKPGFVDTPMTAHLDKSRLFVKPSWIARGIHRAIVRKKETVYLPWFWRIVMGIIGIIPERIFKRLKL